MDAIKVVEYVDEGERFGSLIVSATEDFCEQRAPVLETFISQSSGNNLNWEADTDEGWYTLRLSFQFTIEPERFEGDSLTAEADIKLTCYSCLRLKPTLKTKID